MFRKILLPYDGSKHSDKAVDAAIDICKDKETNCSITLLHADPLVNYWGGELIAVDIDIEEKIKEESVNLLKQPAKKIMDAGIHCDSVIITGDPAIEIYEKASDENYDLIVMGSRGLGAFGELLLGSVSHKVVQHASCPVLIVK